MHADSMAPLVMDVRYFIESLSSNDGFIGLAIGLPFARPMAPVIGCGFRYTSAVSKYEAYTATIGKTTQITNTTIAPKLDDFDFDRLRMEVVSSDGTGNGTIRYFIDEVLVATHTIAPHNAAIVPGFSVRNNSTSFITHAVDMVDIVWPRHQF